MNTTSEPELLYLWHPGTTDTFSGYGLALAPAHLVGLVIIDRPQRADPVWLQKIKETFGAYQLAAMTQGGARGIVCQMQIAQESILHLKTLDHRSRHLSAPLSCHSLPTCRPLPLFCGGTKKAALGYHTS